MRCRSHIVLLISHDHKKTIPEFYGILFYLPIHRAGIRLKEAER